MKGLRPAVASPPAGHLLCTSYSPPAAAGEVQGPFARLASAPSRHRSGTSSATESEDGPNGFTVQVQKKEILETMVVASARG